MLFVESVYVSSHFTFVKTQWDLVRILSWRSAMLLRKFNFVLYLFM
jgi:hypothetical protein